MAKKETYTPEQVIEAIVNARGLLVTAADNLGCSAQTIYNYRKRYVAVERAVRDARERMADYAETRLFDLIEKGEPSAIYFYLKCQAKHRGYVERQEIHTEGKIEVDYVDDWKGLGATSYPVASTTPGATDRAH